MALVEATEPGQAIEHQPRVRRPLASALEPGGLEAGPMVRPPPQPAAPRLKLITRTRPGQQLLTPVRVGNGADRLIDQPQGGFLALKVVGVCRSGAGRRGPGRRHWPRPRPGAANSLSSLGRPSLRVGGPRPRRNRAFESRRPLRWPRGASRSVRAWSWAGPGRRGGAPPLGDRHCRRHRPAAATASRKVSSPPAGPPAALDHLSQRLGRFPAPAAR